jgi:ATP-dependent Clp protease adaptor protein ClpS
MPVAFPDTDTDTAEGLDLTFEPLYHVVLLNDDDHSYGYVVFMLKDLFGYPESKGFDMAYEVDKHGRTVVWTGTHEDAKLRQDQIHAYGPDPTIPRCEGSMTAILEPVE